MMSARLSVSEAYVSSTRPPLFLPPFFLLFASFAILLSTEDWW